MIVTKNDIRKSLPEFPEAIQRLRQYLDKDQPQLVQYVARLWKNQQQAITYAELRRALISGKIDKVTLKAWMQDYSKFIVTTMLPSWQTAMVEASQQITETHEGFVINLTAPNVKAWTTEHAGEFITDITVQQKKAINALIQRASTIQDMGVDQLARAIRPTIGLYPGQAIANMNYMLNVKRTLQETNPTMRTGTAEKRAIEAAAKYAEKQQRYRAEMIARTELASAYNNGEQLAIEQAVEQKIMKPCTKTSVSAGDSRVCFICQNLDGETIGMDEEFLPGKKSPPYHPHCRCVNVFREE